MFHVENKHIAKLLLTGNFGLERETLRVTESGRLSHIDHPFDADDSHIVRDFCENQVEINTGIHGDAQGVINELAEHHKKIAKTLSQLPEKELLWMSSNPPYIANEDDIPVAKFFGKNSEKTTYREYLSNKYGRYKMAFSGIHFNYSFSGELLRKNYEVETGIKVEKGNEPPEYQKYSDTLYLNLAENCLKYGWLIVALTAASPLTDGSFVGGAKGETVFSGMSSIRCSELGYWNFFVPTLDYSSVQKYADSIEHYVSNGLISAPSELYYPIRLKPRGKNRIENLRISGVNHIELRPIDLNPLTEYGIDVRDMEFLQLFLAYLASINTLTLSAKDQVQAVQNFKAAAHYDITNTKIMYPNNRALSVANAAIEILDEMQHFYGQIDTGNNVRISDIINYQRQKITEPDTHSYSRIVNHKFKGDFAAKTLYESIKNRNKNV